MNQGQYEKTKGGKEDNGNDDSDEEAESSDDDYKFAFLQHDMTCSIQDKAQFPRHGYCWTVSQLWMCSQILNCS